MKAKRKKPSTSIRQLALFGAGLASIIIGYILLAALGDIHVAPILLVLGYCVLVPLAFL